MRRVLIGSAIGVVASIALGVAMVPLRSDLGLATPALVLVVPVTAGVVLGGFLAGLASAVAGFLTYDLAFIPPYGSPTVGSGRNWVPLIVYVALVALIARVVSKLDHARRLASLREANAQRLVELSELLLADHTVDELAQVVVKAAVADFDVAGASLLLGSGGRLEVAASAGAPIGEASLGVLRAELHAPVSLSTATSNQPVQTVALIASGRPIGLLALVGMSGAPEDHELLAVLANHAALAIERSQLAERLLEIEVLEEVDRLRRSMVGAVSHDLRSPLATIKVASSSLLDSHANLSTEDVAELHQLIDLQTDRLTRLVNNLLDMTRIQAGVLAVHHEFHSLLDLLSEAIGAIGPALGQRIIEIDIPEWLPLVAVDQILTIQILVNLLDNANRFGPEGTPITVVALLEDPATVLVSVEDEGPDVDPAERQAVFERFERFDTGGRAGLGLAIAKAFVEAHGGTITVGDRPGGGARFLFTLPAALGFDVECTEEA